MSVVPQAAHGEVGSSLFGEHAVPPHLGPHPTTADCNLSAREDRYDLANSRQASPQGTQDRAGSLPSETRGGDDELSHSRTGKAARDESRTLPKAKKRRPDQPKGNGRRLHRVAEVRQQQGVTERTMARRLGMDLKSYRRLEDPTCDLSLSELMMLQAALDVPVADLLVEHHALSRPTQERAKLLKVMKTAAALREAKISPRADRMAQMLCEQLIDLMPELAEVSGWPQFGARRGISAIGKALQSPIDTSGLTIPE